MRMSIDIPIREIPCDEVILALRYVAALAGGGERDAAMDARFPLIAKNDPARSCPGFGFDFFTALTRDEGGPDAVATMLIRDAGLAGVSIALMAALSAAGSDHVISFPFFPDGDDPRNGGVLCVSANGRDLKSFADVSHEMSASAICRSRASRLIAEAVAAGAADDEADLAEAIDLRDMVYDAARNLASGVIDASCGPADMLGWVMSNGGLGEEGFRDLVARECGVRIGATDASPE